MRKNTRNSHPGTMASGPGVNTMTPVAKPAPEEGAGRGADTGGQQDRPALQIGQRPLLGQRRGDVADQKEIEEIQQIGHIRRTNQLPLIAGQPLLLFEAFDHGALLRRSADREWRRPTVLSCSTPATV